MPQNPPKPGEESTAATGRRAVVPGPDRTWLRELDAQHQSLNEIFLALIDRVNRVRKTDDRIDAYSELLRLIADADLLLKAHFAFEEAGGYLSDALAVAPRLSQRAASLQRDHRRLTTLFAKLAKFAQGMREGDENWERLGVAIGDFSRELQLHDLEENRLVQEAYLDDLGGGG